ncbi:FadR/GntR family transcriptional regulator [Lapillicoccus jejuensis]|uniref:DNA-binding FadR family transcriptional regulator n=1 Tax=Lapillicoccus jejuensis TaxID=402171 RepID=A0A542DY59_9MICO|nr:FadR/GntR family transcriptional regulator [Lapillicoccus jejuensis]TQJ07989.1 DNA-binding FadR family transcriptional regulator [Lapillicoccus jejuensis]
MSSDPLPPEDDGAWPAERPAAARTAGLAGSSPAEPWPRRPRRLATAVVDELVDRLVRGEIPAGATLPTEPLLCQTFGVSRTVVREAVKSLESMRLVRVQQGQGTTVRHLGDWDLFNPTVLSAVIRHDAELAILEDLVDVRSALEAQMAGQAAQRADQRQRELLTERMALLEQEVGDPARYLRADVDFHDAVMQASGNRLGRAMIHTLQMEAYRSLRYVGDPTAAEMRLSNVAHRAVHDAVLAGDAEAAQDAMREHIIGSWHRRRPASDAPR